MKTDKELADEVDARDRLRRRGYTQISCTSCDGLGYYKNSNMRPCLSCNGKGSKWRSPIMC